MRNFQIYCLSIYLISNVFSTNIHHFCTITKDVYFIQISNLVVIEDIRKIPSINTNSTCFRNTTRIYEYNIKEKYQKIIRYDFDFKSLLNISQSIGQSNSVNILFIKVEGFELFDRSNDKNYHLKDLSFKFFLYFIESKIAFYDKNSKVKSCSDMNGKNFSSILNKVNLYQLYFERNKIIGRICPLLLNNLVINMFFIKPLIDTFYLTTKIHFDILPDSIEINILVNYLILSGCIRLKLDKNLMSPMIFKHISVLEVLGNIKLIEDNMFNYFKKIKVIKFDAQNFRQQAHRTQLKWIKSLNSNIKVNMSNLSQAFHNRKLIIRINLYFTDPAYFDYENFHRFVDLNNTFPDEDFCLYKSFPFDQMVFFTFDILKYNEFNHPPMTCTLLWLTYNGFLFTFYDISQDKYPGHFDELLNKSRLKENYKNCQFLKRTEKCMVNMSIKKITRNTIAELQYYNFFLMYVLDFFSIPLACLIGMLINILSIIIISKINKNENILVLKQFYYMKLNAVFNFFICFIEFFRLVYTWPNTIGNEIWHLVQVQYLKIIFHEYLLNCLKFSSNLTFILFSLMRISLIRDTNSHSSFWFKLNPKKTSAFIFLLSLLLFSVKLFSFEINYFNPLFDYPSHRNYNYLLINRPNAEKAINILNFINDFINYVLFSIIHFVVDLTLIKQIAENLKKKRKKKSRRQYSESKLENVHIKSLLIMIINTTANFFFKLPGLSEFLFWNRKIFAFMLKKSNFMPSFLFYIINLDRSYLIHVIVIFSIFLHLLSLSLNFLMMFFFNNIFYNSFKNICQKQKTKK